MTSSPVGEAGTSTTSTTITAARRVAARQQVILESMVDERPQADRILSAQLAGLAMHHARWEPLTQTEHELAVGELRELAAGRADLLAEVAGLAEGYGEDEPDAPRKYQVGQLCRDAGADLEAVGEWVEIGRQRRANAKRMPMSGGLHGGGAQRPRRP